MAIHNLIVVTVDETQANVEADLIAETGYVELAGLKLKNFIKMLTSGIRPATIQTKANAVKATGTVTLSSFVADDTVTINGVTFTGKASPSGAEQFAIGADDTESAANLVAKINAHTTLDGMIVATSALGVVTLTALVPGELGNAVTLAISAHGSVSAARMASGTNGTSERTHYYGSAS